MQAVHAIFESTQPVRTAELPSDDTLAPVERVHIAVTSSQNRAALYGNGVSSLIADTGWHGTTLGWSGPCIRFWSAVRTPSQRAAESICRPAVATYNWQQAANVKTAGVRAKSCGEASICYLLALSDTMSALDCSNASCDGVHQILSLQKQGLDFAMGTSRCAMHVQSHYM